jgi:Flagellar hook-length control protein FliK
MTAAIEFAIPTSVVPAPATGSFGSANSAARNSGSFAGVYAAHISISTSAAHETSSSIPATAQSVSQKPASKTPLANPLGTNGAQPISPPVGFAGGTYQSQLSPVPAPLPTSAAMEAALPESSTSGLLSTSSAAGNSQNGVARSILSAPQMSEDGSAAASSTNSSNTSSSNTNSSAASVASSLPASFPEAVPATIAQAAVAQSAADLPALAVVPSGAPTADTAAKQPSSGISGPDVEPLPGMETAPLVPSTVPEETAVSQQPVGATLSAAMPSPATATFLTTFYTSGNGGTASSSTSASAHSPASASASERPVPPPSASSSQTAAQPAGSSANASVVSRSPDQSGNLADEKGVSLGNNSVPSSAPGGPAPSSPLPGAESAVAAISATNNSPSDTSGDDPTDSSLSSHKGTTMASTPTVGFPSASASAATSAAVAGPATQAANLATLAVVSGTAGQPAPPGSASGSANSGSANSGLPSTLPASGEFPVNPSGGPVQMAQIVNQAAQSEMRIGLNTAAFGNVEVRATVHANDVGVVIGSERGDLRSLLSNDLPAIANTLQQQNLRLNQVSFHQPSPGFGFSSQMSSGGDRQPRSFASGPIATMAPPESGNPESTEPAAALSIALSTELSTRSGTGFSVLA